MIESDGPPQPLSEASWLVLSCWGFETQDQAREFGEELRGAAYLAGLCARVGVDAGEPGEDPEKSWINPEILKFGGPALAGSQIVPDVHGIVIMRYSEGSVFVRRQFRVGFQVNANSADFVRALEQALTHGCQTSSGSPSIRRAIRTLSLAEMSEDPLAMVVLAVSAVEGLAPAPKWTPTQQELIQAAADWLESAGDGAKDTREVVDAIRRETSRKSGRQCVRSLLAENGLSSVWDEWEGLYEKRSRLFHGDRGDHEHRGSYLTEQELHKLGQEATKLCALIVLTMAKREGIPVPDCANVHFGAIRLSPTP